MNVIRLKCFFEKNPEYLESVESVMFLESVDEYFIDYGREDEKYYALNIFCTGEDESFRVEEILNVRLNFVKDISKSIEKPEDWIEKWKQSLKPMVITRRIVIDPYPDEKDSVKVIKIIPGMAFGTGEHATTKLAASLVEKYTVKGSNVLDIGCGTGIQSLVAAIGGADKVTAVDLDPYAVNAAREIIEINGFSGKVDVFRSDLLDSVNGRYNLIIANIIFEVLCLLFEKKEAILSVMDKDCRIIFSGIIDRRIEDFRQLVLRNGFEIVEERKEDVWNAMVVKFGGAI